MGDTQDYCFPHRRGPIYAWFSDRGLQRLVLPGNTPNTRPLGCLRYQGEMRWPFRLDAALASYFSGQPTTFAEIPLDLESGTPFQREVWTAARCVPWGATASYGGLAERIGRNRASARAVGRALAANPVPIVVPCHRILAARGGLGGYSSGLDWKRELLELEGYRF